MDHCGTQVVAISRVLSPSQVVPNCFRLWSIIWPSVDQLSSQLIVWQLIKCVSLWNTSCNFYGPIPCSGGTKLLYTLVYNLAKCGSVILPKDSLGADQVWITVDHKWLQFLGSYWSAQAVPNSSRLWSIIWPSVDQ